MDKTNKKNISLSNKSYDERISLILSTDDRIEEKMLYLETLKTRILGDILEELKYHHEKVEDHICVD